MKSSLPLLIALALAPLSTHAAPAHSTPLTSTDAPTGAVLVMPGAPISSAREKQYDLTSQINGRTYRIMVSMPFNADPAKTYPIVYVIDGNWYFRAAADSVTESSGAGIILPAIVVGLSYPTDDNDEVGHRRWFELSLPGNPSGRPQDESQVGGGDNFIRVLLEEVKPFVHAHYHVDQAHQTIYGKSLGGLMVTRILFRHPEAFQNYIAASPALWWNHRAVLADEAAFSRWAKTAKHPVRVLITSAGDEQYRGTDPKRLAEANADRMVDNASDLAERLAALKLSSVTVERAIFADEDHVSVSLASLGRALIFALTP